MRHQPVAGSTIAISSPEAEPLAERRANGLPLHLQVIEAFRTQADRYRVGFDLV